MKWVPSALRASIIYDAFAEVARVSLAHEARPMASGRGLRLQETERVRTIRVGAEKKDRGGPPAEFIFHVRRLLMAEKLASEWGAVAPGGRPKHGVFRATYEMSDCSVEPLDGIHPRFL